MLTPALPWPLIVPLVLGVVFIAVARACYSLYRTSSGSLAVPIVGMLALVGAVGAAIAAFSALGDMIGGLKSNLIALVLIALLFLYFRSR